MFPACIGELLATYDTSICLLYLIVPEFMLALVTAELHLLLSREYVLATIRACQVSYRNVSLGMVVQFLRGRVHVVAPVGTVDLIA